MASEDLHALPLTRLAARLRSGQLSSEAVTRAYLDRIEAVNPRLNAVVQLRREAALREARAADGAPPEARGPLHGVPITIKDSLDTSGIVTTGGTKGRTGFVPREDATVVRRLRAAGAIVMGKTNTPDLTLGYETTNLVYGRTNNPFDPERTSGGSSGGAAAIVAAGGSPLDVGTDTGGSIRLPAHFCGIAGLKPTAGRVPRTGHIIDYAGASQFLTHVGPLPLPDPAAVALAGMRVAHFTKLPPLEPTRETASAVERAVGALERGGGRTRPLGAIPDAERIYDGYMSLLYGDGGAGVARILERWGSTESPLRERLRSMTALPSGELTALHEWLDRWRSRMLALFADHDAIVCPVNVAPAPPHGTFDRATAVYTQVFNLTGWPSTVVRAGTSPHGLPIGVQIVAHPWREDVSLAAAAHVERSLGPFPGPSL